MREEEPPETITRASGFLRTLARAHYTAIGKVSALDAELLSRAQSRLLPSPRSASVAAKASRTLLLALLILAPLVAIALSPRSSSSNNNNPPPSQEIKEEQPTPTKEEAAAAPKEEQPPEEEAPTTKEEQPPPKEEQPPAAATVVDDATLRRILGEFIAAGRTAEEAAAAAAAAASMDDGLPNPDLGLASLGARVVRSQTSPTFRGDASSGEWLLQRMLAWWDDDGGPGEVLDPNVHPGQCWCFAGARGHVTVALPRPAHVTGVSLYHIPKTEAINIGSAPQNFSVWALRASAADADDTEVPTADGAALLGEFSYDVHSPVRSQGFSVAAAATTTALPTTRFVRLSVESNWGHRYTCVYRFRIHGIVFEDN